jgi:hypothetical protein
MLPADAAAVAEEKAKTTDFYADLTDEERAEEGLPPREAAPATDPDPDPDPEPEPDDDATGRLFDEIAGLRDELAAAVGKPEPKTEAQGDILLEAALDHDDPVVRGLAERLQKNEARLDAREVEARAERVTRQMAKDDSDFKAVQDSYQIGGKPMTDAHVDQVEKYLLNNKEVARHLSIEEATRRVFPQAERVGKPSSPERRPKAAGGDGATATIVDSGSSGGAPAGSWQPRPNETIESAVEAFGRRVGWKR